MLARVRVPSGGFVADGATELFLDLWWNFSHVVSCARVFCGLLKNVLISLTPHHKITVHANVFATNYLCHGDLLLEVSFFIIWEAGIRLRPRMWPSRQQHLCLCKFLFL